MKKLVVVALLGFGVSAFAHDSRAFQAGLNKNSSAAMRQIPVKGEREGLAGFAQKHKLVITRAESSCSIFKEGECLLTIYLTRTSYPKYRPGSSDHCGILMDWKAQESNMQWVPFNGGAKYLTAGNAPLLLSLIDDKNSSYCR